MNCGQFPANGNTPESPRRIGPGREFRGRWSEIQQLEYTRHGTVNILNFLMVHTGRMEATCLESNDAEHYVRDCGIFAEPIAG